MLLLAAVLSPFLLAPLAPALCRALGRHAGAAIALLPAAIAVYLWLQGAAIGEGEELRVAYDWVPALGFTLSLRLDGLSLLFGLMISGIGALIFFYAGGYLRGHRHLPRLYINLLLFMGSMLGIVLADNLLLLFVFWELTSLTSYLLIGFDHHRAESRAAALQSLLVTGLGGLALLAGAVLLGMAAGTYEIAALPAAADTIRAHPLYPAIVILIALGAFTKSAQFPFHFWLPSAMEAPTPVSAYLHSSTMVKAGLYLLARLTPTLGDTPLWNTLLMLAGAATMTLGAFLAVRQVYLKRLLAYSTVSALGVVTLGLGVGTKAAIEAATVYLLSHAMYKGALFMVAGAIDHETGEKNVERLGGLRRSMPVLATAAALAALSLAGVPPFSGFVGKELELEAFLHAPVAPTLLTALFALSSALLVVVAVVVGVRPFWGPRGDPGTSPLRGDPGASPLPGEPPRAPGEPPLSLLLGPLVLALLGLLAAIVPLVITEPLVRPAATAILGEPAGAKISLWHGWTLALFLSGLALLVGSALAWTWPLTRAAADSLGFLDALGPAAWYRAVLAALNAVAIAQTRLLQNGSLRFYLAVTVLTAIVAAGYPLLTRVELPHLGALGPPRPGEAALALLVLASAVMAATTRTRLTAIVCLGLAGFAVAALFVLFGAPDLAMTQIAVEALALILFVLVFSHLPDFQAFSAPAAKARDLLIAGAGGALMCGLVLMTGGGAAAKDVSEQFAARAAPEGHGRNVVNVILVDFRALDTLGEITVLAVAAIGVFALVRLRPGSAPAAAECAWTPDDQQPRIGGPGSATLAPPAAPAPAGGGGP